LDVRWLPRWLTAATLAGNHVMYGVITIRRQSRESEKERVMSNPSVFYNTDVVITGNYSTPPLWSSCQTSWLQNGDVLWFMWGTNWIYMLCTGCGRNNSHISKNHCGVSKADSEVWSIPLGRVHNKVFSRLHAVVGWASRLCSGGFFKHFHLSGTVNKQRLLKTLENSMHDLFTAQKWPFGVLCRL
jgi:hypothetical protein